MFAESVNWHSCDSKPVGGVLKYRVDNDGNGPSLALLCFYSQCL